MEKVTLYIKNNANANIPVDLFADPDPNSNIDAVTKYKWDLTGLSFSSSNVTSISLPYRATGGSIFSTFTYSGNISSFSQLLSILNSASIGIFYQLQSGGYTYLAVSNENYVYGNLSLLPASSYIFIFDIDIMISSNVSVSFNFTAPTDISINWGDGTSSNFVNQNGANTYNHVMNAITGQMIYEIAITISASSVVSSVDLSAGGANVDSIQNISSFTAMATIDISNNIITALPNLNAAVINLNCASNQIPSADINTALITLDSNGLLAGQFDSSGQTPSAPPTGVGITAKNNLIGKGWTVTTD